MNADYFSIEVDMSVLNGLSSLSKMILNTPENVRDIPCDTCSNADQCAVDATDCVASRVWYSTGDFLDKDVARLIRKAK
jgi:hypothetical protein